MTRLTKPVLALSLVSALALAAATPSEARNGRNAAAVGAGIAGLAVGTAIGAAAASNYAYGPYGYYDGYNDGYAYAPAPAYSSGYGYNGGYAYAPAPAYTYGNNGYGYDGYAYAPGATVYSPRDPSSYYAPGGSYGPRTYGGWQNRERQLRGGDW